MLDDRKENNEEGREEGLSDTGDGGTKVTDTAEVEEPEAEETAADEDHQRVARE